MTTVGEARATRFLDDAGIRQAPVDVEELARMSGADVRYRTFDGDISGLLLRDDDGSVVIGVHAGHAKTRQRFTIAHELGHHLMHKGRPVIVEHLHRSARINYRDRRSAMASDREEIEANQFAAALLMPRPLLEEAFERRAGHRDTDATIESLARDFRVSPAAMRFRLVNLALIDPT